MRWGRRLGIAAVGSLAVLALADHLEAQAWLPPQGEAFFSFGYANTFITKHYTYQAEHKAAGIPFQPGDNIEDDRGHIRSQSVGAQVGYAFTDRLTVELGAPYTEAKWYTVSDYGKPHKLADGRTLDDGRYHGT